MKELRAVKTKKRAVSIKAVAMTLVFFSIQYLPGESALVKPVAPNDFEQYTAEAEMRLAPDATGSAGPGEIWMQG